MARKSSCDVLSQRAQSVAARAATHQLPSPSLLSSTPFSAIVLLHGPTQEHDLHLHTHPYLAVKIIRHPLFLLADIRVQGLASWRKSESPAIILCSSGCVASPPSSSPRVLSCLLAWLPLLV